MSLVLNATLREDMGKGASRRLRHANMLPGIVYGAGKDPVNITLQQKDVQHELPNEQFYSQVLSLVIDGKAEDVLLRDIQHHPYRQQVMHMDFIRISQDQVVHVHSPLHFVGEEVSPGVRNEGGVVNHMMMEVELECLPKDIPEFIEVDISEMHVGDIVHLSDLKLADGITIPVLNHGEEYDAVVAVIHRKGTGEAEEYEEGEGEAEQEGGETE
jgi:large subunit ribosomal protein L25